MTAWGLENRIVRAQAVATIPRARLLCAAQFSDSSGDWIEISLGEKIEVSLEGERGNHKDNSKKKMSRLRKIIRPRLF